MDWNIQKRSKGCVSCEKEFIPKEEIFCLLQFETDGVLRTDFCDVCWQEKVKDIEENKSYISYWRSVYNIVEQDENKKSFEKDAVESLLRKWIEIDDIKYQKLCYLLAVMLERKKVLLEKKSTLDNEQSKDHVIYEKPKTGESFVLINPRLNMSEISLLQGELSSILEAEQIVI